MPRSTSRWLYRRAFGSATLYSGIDETDISLRSLFRRGKTGSVVERDRDGAGFRDADLWSLNLCSVKTRSRVRRG